MLLKTSYTLYPWWPKYDSNIKDILLPICPFKIFLIHHSCQGFFPRQWSMKIASTSNVLHKLGPGPYPTLRELIVIDVRNHGHGCLRADLCIHYMFSPYKNNKRKLIIFTLSKPIFLCSDISEWVMSQAMRYDNTVFHVVLQRCHSLVNKMQEILWFWSTFCRKSRLFNTEIPVKKQEFLQK